MSLQNKDNIHLTLSQAKQSVNKYLMSIMPTMALESDGQDGFFRLFHRTLPLPGLSPALLFPAFIHREFHKDRISLALPEGHAKSTDFDLQGIPQWRFSLNLHCDSGRKAHIHKPFAQGPCGANLFDSNAGSGRNGFQRHLSVRRGLRESSLKPAFQKLAVFIIACALSALFIRLVPRSPCLRTRLDKEEEIENAVEGLLAQVMFNGAGVLFSCFRVDAEDIPEEMMEEIMTAQNFPGQSLSFGCEFNELISFVPDEALIREAFDRAVDAGHCDGHNAGDVPHPDHFFLPAQDQDGFQIILQTRGEISDVRGNVFALLCFQKRFFSNVRLS